MSNQAKLGCHRQEERRGEEKGGEEEERGKKTVLKISKITGKEAEKACI